MKLIPVYKRNKNKIDEIVSWSKMDNELFDKASKYIWRLSSKGYANRSVSINGKEFRYGLHYFVIGLNIGDTSFSFPVDHIDRDRLNNQLENLRQCTPQINAKNRSKKGGVFFEKDRNKWRAKYYFKYKSIHIGRFATKEEAELALQMFHPGGEIGFD